MDYARQKPSDEEYNQDHAQRDDRLELAVILSLIVSHPAAVKFLRTLLVDGRFAELDRTVLDVRSRADLLFGICDRTTAVGHSSWLAVVRARSAL